MERIGKYDSEIQMYRTKPSLPNILHWEFQRWLLENRRGEHEIAGSRGGDDALVQGYDVTESNERKALANNKAIFSYQSLDRRFIADIDAALISKGVDLKLYGLPTEPRIVNEYISTPPNLEPNIAILSKWRKLAENKKLEHYIAGPSLGLPTPDSSPNLNIDSTKSETLPPINPILEKQLRGEIADLPIVSTGKKEPLTGKDRHSEPNLETLRFLRWLAENQRLEHDVVGPPSGELVVGNSK